MKSSAKTYVLDANAILDYVQDGPGAATMERVLREAFRRDATLMISVINLGEVFYWLWRNKGEQRSRQTIDDLSLLPLQIIPVDLPQALKAGELKALHKIPYADGIAAALAVAQNATLVTSDRDFEKLGRHFPILWIARP
ncbi:putative Ribonuclease VapC [Candidatus Sulfotelmatobacter kueseliae]|uniref:Putative Ribonuclease VapC n=1 Tax=Candidatus Sulfotelmatobacter kueseliae TaxID=2042962 RepID=A0A2U3L6T2_9BACT|nr:putative Ribonuclease VapC [Candidatus Sulfotelmatobacter kueseliae]